MIENNFSRPSYKYTIQKKIFSNITTDKLNIFKNNLFAFIATLVISFSSFGIYNLINISITKVKYHNFLHKKIFLINA